MTVLFFFVMNLSFNFQAVFFGETDSKGIANLRFELIFIACAEIPALEWRTSTTVSAVAPETNGYWKLSP